MVPASSPCDDWGNSAAIPRWDLLFGRGLAVGMGVGFEVAAGVGAGDRFGVVGAVGVGCAAAVGFGVGLGGGGGEYSDTSANSSANIETSV